MRRELALLAVPTGVGKSTTGLRAALDLVPPAPGELDARPESPAPLAVVCVETRRAMVEAAAEVAAHARETGRGVEARLYTPLSRVRLGGGEVEGESEARECPLAELAELAEARGIPARPSLCLRAGTDALDAVGEAAPGPCPRLAKGCVAADPWQGRRPGGRPGDRWAAVVSADAAEMVPAAIMGAPHIVDECARLSAPRPVALRPGPSPELARARALVRVLPRSRPSAREAVEAGEVEGLRADAVCAAFAGLVAWFAELATVEGLGALVTLAPEAREGAMVEALRAWASSPPEGELPLARLARRAWPSVGGEAAALDLWRAASPMVATWRRREAREAGAELWRALAAWSRGAPCVAEVEAVEVEGARAERATGGVVVLAPHPAAARVGAWIARGPVIALDGTVDAGALALAVGVLAPRAAVGGVRGVALTVADPGGVSVRRVILRTEAATRGRTLDGGRPRWASARGAAAGGVLRGVLRAVLAWAPALDGSERGRLSDLSDDGRQLAPGVVFMARPLALALAALAGLDASAEARELAEGAPADVAELARELARRSAGLTISHHGSTLARGTNDLARAGARWAVTVGDARPPGEAARAKAPPGREAFAQGTRDAAEAAAQALARVRFQSLDGGAVLLLHAGAVCPLGWVDPVALPLDARATPRAGVETVSPGGLPKGEALDARATARAGGEGLHKLEARVVQGSPSPPPVSPPSPSAAPEVLAAAAAGWTPARVSLACGCDPRVARRWWGGTRPRPGALAGLRAALDAGDALAPWRAVLRPGRRAVDVVRGVRGVPSLASLVALALAEAEAEGLPPGVRVVAEGEVEAEALRRWAGGEAEALAPELAASLAFAAPVVARWWAGGEAAEAETRGALRRAAALDPLASVAASIAGELARGELAREAEARARAREAEAARRQLRALPSRRCAE